MQYVSLENLSVLTLFAKIILYWSIKITKFSLNLISLNFKPNNFIFCVIYTFADRFPGISSELCLVSVARDVSYVYL